MAWLDKELFLTSVILTHGETVDGWLCCHPTDEKDSDAGEEGKVVL